MSGKIHIKTPGEIAKLQKAGEMAAKILMEIGAQIQPGRTTREIDEFAKELFKREKCGNAFFGYRGYKGQICISVNEEVVHGIGGDRMINSGDIVSLDVGTCVDGWIGDNAMTVPVGIVEPDTLRLLAATEESLFRAIQCARPGVPLADVCAAVEAFVKPRGFTVVRDFVGHGVGREMHEEPQIPNYRPMGKTPRLKKGMVLAIEPMVNLGKATVRVLSDGWTVVTADHKPSAHFEHTIAVMDDEPLILTNRPRIALPEQLGVSL
ncbi:MAG: type I methionyl aminopeptidase [Akkermansia sp.]